MVHEITHFIITGDTDDPSEENYGPENALALAKSEPAKARRNAENIEYFVESIVAGT